MGSRLLTGYAALALGDLTVMFRHELLQNPLLRFMHFDELHAEALAFHPSNDPHGNRDRKFKAGQKQFKLQRLGLFNSDWALDETARQGQI